jgi:carbon-monoxide dehydrogenase large subunit
MYASGTAILEGAEEVIKNGKQIAGFVLEASAGDIEFADGRFTIAGTDRSIGIMELADRLRGGLKLPEGVPSSLSVKHVTAEPIPSVFPNGCHVAEVEVDPETGEIEVVSYNSVNDFGTLINPLLVAGQVHGGVVQGIGQAIMEKTAYDADGQLLTGSYMDYAMPRASDMPEIGFESHPVPAKNNPLGVKGCGEAGCAGALTSVMNAIVDALSEYGVANIEMPATPERVWQTIQDAKAQHTM